jgi:membrane protease subunit (stomatin/prohibitin family)
VGTLKITDAMRIEEFFIGEIGQRFSDAVAEFFTKKENSVFQANAKLNELSRFTLKAITKEFGRYGIEIVNFNVERISIPAEEMAKFQEVLGKRMEIDQVSKAQVGAGYTTMRTYDTLEKAASSEGGAGNLMGTGLGLGLGFGAGIPVGSQLGQAMSPQQAQQVGKPAKQSQEEALELLKKLKELLDAGAITKEEYEAKKKEILARI